VLGRAGRGVLTPWVFDMVLNADLPGLVNVYITMGNHHF
jgi:hypothetical protein